MHTEKKNKKQYTSSKKGEEEDRQPYTEEPPDKVGAWQNLQRATIRARPPWRKTRRTSDMCTRQDHRPRVKTRGPSP